jgi:cell division septation protein DedD
MHRRPSSSGRLVLFLAGGAVTAILLVIVLISLEGRSPIQGALREPAPPLPHAPGLKEPSSTTVPEMFSFYETLEQRSHPSSGFMDNSSGPTPRPVPPGTSSDGAGVSPKKQPLHYTIQIASVKDKPTADALSQRLKRKGYPVFILPHVIPKRGTWYRVRVGHFTKRDEAQELAQKISRKERLTTYIAKE